MTRFYHYVALVNDGSEIVVIQAKNQFIARALINEDAEKVQKITTDEAKRLLARGVRKIS